nr:hypothetical protein F02E9.2b - Caenorhabditis elegans [Caenorhabditis elegans]
MIEAALENPVPIKSQLSPTPRYFGSCKWFNVSKGYGFVIDDITGEDLFVHQSNLNMQGFRSLDEGERVSYYIQERSNGKGREAYAVSGEVEGQGLKGSRIHPLGRKKAVSLRCFRCGKFATHKAKSCPNVKTDAKLSDSFSAFEMYFILKPIFISFSVSSNSQFACVTLTYTLTLFLFKF